MVAFLCASLTASRVVSGENPKGKFNLLLITIDTLRPDRLSSYSPGHIKTPNIDILAERGVLFSRAFAQTTTTLPSHTNILLGTTPLVHGVHDDGNFTVSQDLLTLAEHLKKQAYSTAAFVGGFPLDHRFGLNQGFDVYDDEFDGRKSKRQIFKERKAEVVVERSLQWLGRQASPWFLWVHCYDPHYPYEPPEPFLTLYKDRPYDGEVAYVDSALKKLLDYVRGQGIMDSTVIIFTGDHGESLGQHGEETHGYFAYNSTLWVPLIICSPGLKSGKVDQQAVHTDIFPTVCELLKIEKPPNLEGLSLLPAVKGKKLPNRAVYFESLYPHYSLGWAPLTGYLQDSEKFIESPIPELYDMGKDFDELKNLIAGKDVNKYRARLSQLIGNRSAVDDARSQSRLDRQSLEKLRSLGYLAGPQGPKKQKYDPKDDIKTLLPYQTRSYEAVNLYDKGRKKEGIELLLRILAEREDIDIAYSMLAGIYKREGRMDDALRILEKGMSVLPSSLKILSNYITFLNEAGRFDDVIRLISAGGNVSLKDDPESWNALGFAFTNKGDFPKALEALEKALVLDKENAVVYQNLGNLYLSIYLKTKDARDYRKSIDHYRKALEVDPADVWSYNGLGTVHLQGGEPQEAILCFERVLKVFPDYAPALYHMGLAQFNAGDKEKALETLIKFKEKFAGRVSPAQLSAVESLIQKCRSK